MKKSQCYRACKGADNKVVFVLTDSLLEVVTDSEGNKYNIHFHRVGSEWAATEEKSGMRCVPYTYRTRKRCYVEVMKCLDLYKRLLAQEQVVAMANALKEYKENLI